MQPRITKTVDKVLITGYHYVTESVQVEAEFSIQCEDSVVHYR